MKNRPSPRKKIFLIGGARPNFVKIAALTRAFTSFKKAHPKSGLRWQVIHTGQHYDFLMVKSFFRDLDIPSPYIDLNVGSSPHGEQTAKIISRFEKVVLHEKPDLILVVGDVNSTLACSLVGVKVGIPVAHVESGLRSFDRTMPEEINRRVTDAVADYLFTTCRDADRNLIKEGIDPKSIFFVGNVMVDTLLVNLPKVHCSNIRKRLGLGGDYAVLTLHRPSNVDQENDFMEILKALEHIQRCITIIFPVHPRTARRIKGSAVGEKMLGLQNIKLTSPLRYLDFIALVNGAKLVLTDSGGIQEETTMLGVPCLTLRDNTERPVTINQGSNFLAGRESGNIIRLADKILSRKGIKKFKKPTRWDGRAADRIVQVLSKKIGF
ncbi:MAG: UDP-N-acetylglucosamine 2-epimerase (non-hydrolyzing) [Candidatus Omnitrophica bacterium]|nr:UDP-N-acetylglucosamine 2-epimerase (non-hydrolyzing) [Candidatus Omnitrophota bacterium]